MTIIMRQQEAHFAGKKRLWEIRWQIQVKRTPKRTALELIVVVVVVLLLLLLLLLLPLLAG